MTKKVYEYVAQGGAVAGGTAGVKTVRVHTAQGGAVAGGEAKVETTEAEVEGGRSRGRRKV